jgi:hypothetical protein
VEEPPIPMPEPPTPIPDPPVTPQPPTPVPAPPIPIPLPALPKVDEPPIPMPLPPIPTPDPPEGSDVKKFTDGAVVVVTPPLLPSQLSQCDPPHWIVRKRVVNAMNIVVLIISKIIYKPIKIVNLKNSINLEKVCFKHSGIYMIIDWLYMCHFRV